MIIQPARIIVIDDNKDHLKSLTDTLCKMGSGCLPFHYEDDPPESKLLKGARFIFCDLHLTSDGVTSDKKTQYSIIASMLADRLNQKHGPYVLIVWSEFPEEVNALEEFLQRLDIGQRPLKCCVLNKNDYISTESSPGKKTANLSSAIEGLFEDIPGLSALMDWEQKVMLAASETTSVLWSLCENVNEVEDEGTIKQDVKLRNTLRKLASGASGDITNNDNPGRGVFEALSPLLADQLEKGTFDEELWKSVVSVQSGQSGRQVYEVLTPLLEDQIEKGNIDGKFWKTVLQETDSQDEVSGAALYSMLYFEVPSAHSNIERGVVCQLPKEWAEDDKFLDKFGCKKEKVLEEFGFKENLWEEVKNDCKWCFVQMNAACDQAQNNLGFIPYVLACMIKKNTKPKKHQN